MAEARGVVRRYRSAMRLRSAVLILSLALAGACRSTREPGAIPRHFDAQVLLGGLEAQAQDRAQWAPALAFAALAPLVAVYDHELSDGASDHGITGSTQVGDAVHLLLGGGALAYGGVQWVGGDQGESFEVAAEAILLTGGVTQALKKTTRRSRPGGSASHASFPSGHTSLAFAGATFLAREIESRTGSRLGYWLYVPAALVALNRVEGERHWPSDVAAGAAIGIFLTNWVYNAHFPGAGRTRATIFEDRRRAAWSFGPRVVDERLALGLSMSL